MKLAANTFCTLVSVAFLVCFSHGRELGLKIIGGKNTPWATFPFMASLLIQLDGNLVRLCGGTIIHPRWILSAAHCFEGVGFGQVEVYVGNTQFASGKVHKAKALHIHEAYNGNDDDIALIELQNAIKKGEGQKITLNVDPIPLGAPGILIGWGLTSTENADLHLQSIPHLRSVDLHIAKCQMPTIIDLAIPGFQFPIYQSVNDLNDKRLVCTSTTDGKGACVGDSGGPLIVKSKQVGIVSRGLPCATGAPDIYTNVRYYIDWIQRKINTRLDY